MWLPKESNLVKVRMKLGRRTKAFHENMCVQRCAARHLVDQFSLFLYGWELATVA